MREIVHALAAGDWHDGLLGNCKMEWAGGEAYGEEAIREAFRIAPLDVSGGTLVETAAALAWIDGANALVADLYDGRIARIWRVGAGTAILPERAISVAFDPDLRQQRGDVFLRREDHLELEEAAFEKVSEAGRTLIAGELAGDIYRARAFVVRAFSAEMGTAALFAVHRVTRGSVRSQSFGYAVAFVDGAAPAIIRDQAVAPTLDLRF